MNKGKALYWRNRQNVRNKPKRGPVESKFLGVYSKQCKVGEHLSVFFDWNEAGNMHKYGSAMCKMQNKYIGVEVKDVDKVMMKNKWEPLSEQGRTSVVYKYRQYIIKKVVIGVNRFEAELGRRYDLYRAVLERGKIIEAPWIHGLFLEISIPLMLVYVRKKDVYDLYEISEFIEGEQLSRVKLKQSVKDDIMNTVRQYFFELGWNEGSEASNEGNYLVHGEGGRVYKIDLDNFKKNQSRRR